MSDQIDLPARVLAMCKARGWSLHWTARGAYLHLESSELIEAVRGKRGDKKNEAADVLIVLMSITQSQGIAWSDVVAQASKRTDELMATADTPYKGEERADQQHADPAQATATGEIERLKTQLAAANQAQDAILATLNHHKAKLNEDLTAAESKLTTANAQVEKLREENARLKAMVDAVQEMCRKVDVFDESDQVEQRFTDFRVQIAAACGMVNCDTPVLIKAVRQLQARVAELERERPKVIEALKAWEDFCLRDIENSGKSILDTVIIDCTESSSRPRMCDFCCCSPEVDSERLNSLGYWLAVRR